MRAKIRLDTQQDVIDFVNTVNSVSEPDERIMVSDGDYQMLNARSIMGMLLTWHEWSNITLISEKDHFFDFRKFIIEE